jgi:hypothetical protein
MYYETLGAAVVAGLSIKLPKWHVLEEKDIEAVTWEAMSYETSQTKRYPLQILKGFECKEAKKVLSVSIYRMPSGRYELTAYVA